MSSALAGSRERLSLPALYGSWAYVTLSSMEAEVKNYEIAYLISPEVAEDEVFGQAGKITSFIQESKGLVGHIEEPKSRRLSYPLARKKTAYFGWTTFAMDRENLADFEAKLKAEKSIVRYLISEEIKQPVVAFRPPRPVRVQLERRPIRPFVPQAPKEEDQTKIEELDKKLEEILGK